MTKSDAKKGVVSEVDRKIGKKIKQIRTASGLKLSEVSKRSGISVSHLSALEGGARRIHVDNLYAIAEALGVCLQELLDYDAFDEAQILDCHLTNVIKEWEEDSRKKEVAVLLREFRNLTPVQIEKLVELAKTINE